MPDKPKRKKRRRIFDLEIDEISLVPEPAVPQAKFIICKADAAAIDSVMRRHGRTPAADIEAAWAARDDGTAAILEAAGRGLIARKAERQRKEQQAWQRAAFAVGALRAKVEALAKTC